MKTSTRVGRGRGGLLSFGAKESYLEDSDPAEDVGRRSEAADSS